MLKHGTESERAALLARIITNNVGEMNKKLAATPTGQMKQLQMTIGGIKAKIGRGAGRLQSLSRRGFTSDNHNGFLWATQNRGCRCGGVFG